MTKMLEGETERSVRPDMQKGKGNEPALQRGDLRSEAQEDISLKTERDRDLLMDRLTADRVKGNIDYRGRMGERKRKSATKKIRA